MKQVCIVGGAALDITGMPDGVCRLRDSNLGAVRMQVGGVGRMKSDVRTRAEALSLLTGK